MIAFLYALGFVVMSLPKDMASVTQFYPRGRLPLRQKVSFFRNAKHEVIEVGVSLRTLISYFDQMPSDEFKNPVLELLTNGCYFRFLLLDPESDVAKKYAEDRREPKLIDTIRRSIETLCKLRDDLNSKGFSGKVEIRTYSHFPSCYVMLVDPTTKRGRIQVSHYLHSVKRADSPVVEIHKSTNPALFETYTQFVTNLLTESKAL